MGLTIPLVILSVMILLLWANIPVDVDKQPTNYESEDGFMTSVWGSMMWHFCHIISFNYKVNPSQQDKQHYRDFVYSLQHVLPCVYCRDSFAELLKQYPLTDQVMHSRESFSRWMYDTHNKVNQRLNKPKYKTYEQIRDFYEQFRARCSKQKQNIKPKGCLSPLYRKHICFIDFKPQ